ncbi:MAG: prepilin-type N-terminal cleavage/methylation domain-containing protein [Verrucomicrobia bacterium]|nr:prepilin-type N-terminal cleavage/methylation domain-containing protein [Verrucomicrobiota bacterium]
MRLNLSQPNLSQSGAATSVFGRSSARVRSVLAFTLIEMLVVIIIIAIISSIAIPAINGLTKSNTMSTATRQLLDDVAYARQKAISGRTTVYMVFVPPEFWSGVNAVPFNALNPVSKKQANTLLNGQYTSYALYVERTLGDQIGRNATNYLTAWRSLPEGVLIETNKFSLLTNLFETIVDPYDKTRQFEVRPFQRRSFVFPSTEITNVVPRKFELPYIAFNPQGGLVSLQDEFITLSPGSIFYLTNSAGGPLAPDVVQTGYREATRTNFTLIRVDSLTGRAKLERMEIQ